MTRSATAMFAAVVAAVAIGGSTVPSLAQGGVRVGDLNCDISGGIGMIITSHKAIRCVFTSADPRHRREIYVGSINKFGLDLGVTSGGSMAWAVYAPTSRGFGALAGRYSGASAEATVGIGPGVNVLVGGSNRTITLQPVSIQGQTGLNVAAGVSELTLRPVVERRHRVRHHR